MINNNWPVIGRIAKKTFKANSNRNIVAIIAIILTTVLFTTVFTMGFGMINTVKKENIRRAGGDGQVILSNITDTVYNDLKNSSFIDEIAYTKLVADEILDSRLNDLRTEMWYMDETAIAFAGYKLEAGHLPQTVNEIIADSEILEKLGIHKKVGEIIKLQYRVKDEIKTQSFILAGYWKPDTISNVGRILVSKQYLEKNNSELEYSYNQDLNYSGSVSVYINFKNSQKLTEQITALLNEFGYVWEGTSTDKKVDNYVIARISPAYQSVISFDDPSMIGAMAGAVLLIFITGYLIIYNIFQISIIQDIRFYGQLKTLGTTRKQIKKLIKKQIYKLSLIGIPIGLIFGYILGILLVPVLMKSTEYSEEIDSINMAITPIIFIGAVLFSFITINISVRTPGKIASKVSPLEALKFGELGKKKKNIKRSTNGGKLYRMAFANLGRNKKRTVLVILSLALSAVLFNTVFTLTNGFDEEKYVDKFIDKDFIISTIDYFNYRFETSNLVISENDIDYVKNQPEFSEGGKLLAAKVVNEQFYVENLLLASANRNENNWPMIALYGVDDYLLKSMKILQGNLDFEKLKSGTGIIVGLTDDGTGMAEGTNPLNIGEKIKIIHKASDGSSEVYEMEVVAKVLIKENTYTTRQTGNPDFFVPAEIFIDYVEEPVTVSYPFDCKDGNQNVNQMQKKLESYVKSNNNLNFDSKQTYVTAFNGIKNTFVIVGGAMGLIIAFIGIINFLNAMVTSVLTRKNEFAMMQSVGMTNKQLKNMLCMEGLTYAVTTIVLSLITSVVISFTMVKVISASIWFFTFNFTLVPISIISPIFIGISIVVPYMLCRRLNKESVIERLRAE